MKQTIALLIAFSFMSSIAYSQKPLDSLSKINVNQLPQIERGGKARKDTVITGTDLTPFKDTTAPKEKPVVLQLSEQGFIVLYNAVNNSRMDHTVIVELLQLLEAQYKEQKKK